MVAIVCSTNAGSRSGSSEAVRARTSGRLFGLSSYLRWNRQQYENESLFCRCRRSRHHPGKALAGRRLATSRHGPVRAARLLVAVDLLALFVTLLCFHRQRRDRTGLEPLQRDRFAGLLAIAVGIVLDPLQRRVDLGDQLALAVAGTQFDGAIGLGRGTIGEIGMIDVLFLERLQRDPRFPQDLVLPCEQLGAKVIALPVVHERLFFGGSISLQLFQGQPICTYKADEKGSVRAGLI